MLIACLACAAFRCLYHLAGLGAAACGSRPGPAALSRCVSCAHAFALAALGALATAWPALGGAPWWRAMARALPLGYLAHDAALIWGEPELWEPWMLAHHCAFAALVIAGAEKYPGITARAYLAELSTPLLHAAWAAHRSGADRRHPRAFGALGLALLAVFFVFRVCSLAALSLEAFSLGEWGPGALMTGLTGLNWYWFSLLLRRAMRAPLEGSPAQAGPPPGGRRLRPLRKI